jgi:hypothetical protein
LDTLATKVDLAQVKAELQRDIAEVKADLERDLAETKADILKWLVGMIAGAVVINAMSVIGAMLALVRIVAH